MKLARDERLPQDRPTSDDGTLPRLLLEHARTRPDAVALRKKDRGIWRQVTWRGYAEQVRRFALGLAALDLERGEKVCIVGDNRPEWIMAELAAQACGAASVGLYQDSLPAEMAYVIQHSDAKFVVAEDQEQVDKMLEIRDQIPQVRGVIYWDPKGMRHYRDPWLLSFGEVQLLGDELNAREPGRFEQMIAEVRPQDLAMIVYTSGTTGRPKGAMLTHRNLLAAARRLSGAEALTDRDETLSYLPPAWIGEQAFLISALFCGFTVNFPEEPETLFEDLREIGPTVLLAPPRIWESILTDVEVKIADSSRLKRLLYRRLLPIGQRMADLSASSGSGGKPSLGLRLAHLVADRLVLRPVRDSLGLLRARRVYTGGAPLGPEVFRWYHSIGVPLKQVYGQTETTGICSGHPDAQIRHDTVGVPFPGVEVRVSDEGEVLIRGPVLFQGYYKNEEATRSALRDGWLHTGDHGLIGEQSHVVIVDRMTDLMRLQDGTPVAPQYIENKLKFSPYIKEAVVFAHDRPHVAALLNIDFSVFGKWAERSGLAYTTFVDLSQRPEVAQVCLTEVERVNAELPRNLGIRCFVVLYKELDPDDDEITRTRKVRRSTIDRRYARLIEALYDGSSEVPIEADVQYRDGRQARIETLVRVIAVDAPVPVEA
jgi:long-chain acyl-CoA synthetase